MNKQLIQSVLEDYLQALYRCGTSEEQDRVGEAIQELTEGRNMETDINNANHPARQKAIEIMNYIELHFGEEMFDCDEEKQTTTWYDVEDRLTNIIVRKE